MAAQLGLDDETYRQLKSLEGREIRPEDYDLLGRLDENLKRETLEGKCLHVFPTEVYESALCPVDKINVAEYRACLASSGGEGLS